MFKIVDYFVYFILLLLGLSISYFSLELKDTVLYYDLVNNYIIKNCNSEKINNLTLSFNSLILFLCIFSFISFIFVTLKKSQQEKNYKWKFFLSGFIISITFFEILTFLEFSVYDLKLNLSNYQFIYFVVAYFVFQLLKSNNIFITNFRFFLVSFILSYFTWAKHVFSYNYLNTLNQIFYYPENNQTHNIKLFHFQNICSTNETNFISASIFYLFLTFVCSILVSIVFYYLIFYLDILKIKKEEINTETAKEN